MTRQYRLTVNGKTSLVTTEPHQSLLDTLRETLGLTGSKKGCDEGECASCTVLLDGVPVNSCLVLIGDAVGKSITTIEGVAGSDGPHPLQRAFVELGGVQCGYCTPGMVVSSCALLREQPDPTDEEIKFYLAGNICRCTGYNKITAAVRAAAETMRAADVPAPTRRTA
ncbi:MAG TPA: (2Fe-2S)-binding protein [Vicinamibacterales bacterium]|nr:(2Fe-2S)-binding protein [Vicinamibacterales bacterium]